MVDDDPVHLELSEQFLKRQSPEYEIVPAETPEEAMNLLIEDNFDVAVCDIDLGEGQPTGLDILKQVRVNEREIPVIIFTGKSREEIAIQALNLGADYYIRKSSSQIEGLYAELSYYILTSVEKRRTERALVESEYRLRESEAKLAEAQRIAHLGHWVWDIVNNHIVWSDEIYRIFGLAPQEFEATYEAFLNTVHEDDRQFVRESVDKAINEDQKYSIDHRIVLPDGTIRFVHEEAEMTFDEDGKPVRMMGTVQDITERKLTETALSANEQMFRTIFEESPICVELFDTDGILVGANQATLDLFGVDSLEDLVGFDLFSDPNTPDYVKESLRRGEIAMTEWIFDFSKVKVHDLYKTKKSGIMYLDCVYSPIKYGEDEDLRGFIIHIQNVTDRALAEQALVESRERDR
ncbi:MAG: PAS domain-containing protein, partial [Candidatus Thorarchaeota archaeon]